MMKNFVSMGSVSNLHCVSVCEGGSRQPLRLFPKLMQAQQFAALECVRLGLPRCYAGIKSSD